jgi:hypothetical protein
MPPPNHVKTILAEVDKLGLEGRDVDWLRSRMTAVATLEMARGGVKMEEDKILEALSICIDLIAHGWCVGGLPRGTISGWLTDPKLGALPELPDRDRYQAAIDEALRMGQLARTRDNLTIDRFNPRPTWSESPQINSSEFDYLRVVYSYWMFAGRTELATEGLKKLAATEKGKELGLDARPNVLPLAWEAFEELAKGAITPNDVQKDKLCWWVGQLDANLELAYREMPKTILVAIARGESEVRILHLGSADGSQSYFLASAMEHCLAKMKAHPDNAGIAKQLDRMRVKLDALDYSMKPKLGDGTVEFVQSDGPMVPVWPLLASEVVESRKEAVERRDRIEALEEKLSGCFSQKQPAVDDQGAFDELRRLHQSREIMSASKLLGATIESVPFAYRRPRANRPSAIYAVGEERRVGINFAIGDAFKPETYPNRDYDLVVMTNVLPWVVKYYKQSGFDEDPEKRLLESALDAVASKSRPEAAIVLDAPSVMTWEAGHPTTVQHNTPSRMDEFEYAKAKMIASDRFDRQRVLLSDPSRGLMTLEETKRLTSDH